MTIVEQARAFAQKAHEGQMYGKFPYMVHLDDVHEILRGVTDDETVLAAAYLHDVIEDCPIEREQELIESFDSDIVKIVVFCTKNRYLSRKENNEILCEKIRTSKRIRAISVKLADRIANMRASRGKLFDIGKVELYASEAVGILNALDVYKREPMIEAMRVSISSELNQAVELINATHRLKIWPEYFSPVVFGTKNFEVRKNDRNYQVGDILVLQEYRKDILEYTGRICVKQVTYILKGGDFGIAPNFCVLGLKDR